MRRNIYNSIFYCILGVVLIVLSLLALIYQENFLMRVFDLLGWILIVNGLLSLVIIIVSILKGR